MRFGSLTLITAAIAAADQILATQTPPPVGVLAGHRMPTGEMQVIGKASQFDVPPKLVSGAAPIYPITRLRRGESGYAEIAFTIDEYGHTRDFSVLKTSYPYFASHAIAAMQKWQFQPASTNGRPVSCRVRIPFRYQPRR